MINKIKKKEIRYRVYAVGDKADCSTQTDIDHSCFICNYKWDTVYDLYSHLLIHCHRNKNFLTCLRCKFKMNLHSIEDHECLRNNSKFIQHKSFFSIKFGLPIVCLLCGGRRFQSKALLFTHMICYHNQRELKRRQCGKCDYKIKKTKINLKLEIFNLPNYNDEFDKHIRENHVYGYDLSFIQQLNLNSEKREPYACVACSAVMSSNDKYEAHILCRHSNHDQSDRDTFVCKMCGIPYWYENKFNEHVNSVHTVQIRQLANQLAKDGALKNDVDLGTICLYCWSYFENTLRLHVHLLIQHTYFTTSIVCGLCSMDFQINRDLQETYDLFLRHSEGHYEDISTRMSSKINIFCEPTCLKDKQWNKACIKKPKKKSLEKIDIK